MTGSFRETVSVFRLRNYRLFWVGSLVSNIGRWFQTVAIPIVIFDLTGSAGWVGFAGFAQIMPMALVTSVGGAVADRYQRRTVLFITQSLQALVAVALTVQWFVGVRSPTAYVVTSVFVGATAGLNLPAWQAIVSEMVPREKLLAGITMNSAQFNGSRMIGPALGGLAIAAWGPGWAFFVNAISYGAVLGSLLLMSMPHRDIDRSHRLRPLHEFAEAARYAAARRGIRIAILTVSMVGFFGLSLQTLSVTIAAQVFDRGEQGFGLMLGCVGLGAVLSAPFVAGAAGRIKRSRIVETALILYAGAALLIAFAPWFELALVGSFFMGVAHISTGSTLNTSIQLQVDEAIRAKVMALYITSLTAANPTGQLLIGQLIDATDPRVAYTCAGGAFIVIASWLAFRGHLGGLDIDEGTYEPVPAVAEVHPSTPAPPRGYQPSPKPDSSPSDR